MLTCDVPCWYAVLCQRTKRLNPIKSRRFVIQRRIEMKFTTVADIQLTRARAQLLAVAKTWADPEAVKHYQSRFDAARRNVHACRASNLYARAHERRIH